jgi:hypothetical protein
MTHPAFISMESTGLWVGKFETGYKGSTDRVSAEHDTIAPGSVQIKPNVNSWRNIQVANAFYSSYDYKREFDSHMMKNTEWGSVAYLQHSKYGSMNSVRINNNENYVTGYAATKEPTCGYTDLDEECNRYGATEDITKPYNTEVGYLASTTGNISGIYDMSGGAHEYTMGVLLDQNGELMSGRNSLSNSGFNGTFGWPTGDGDTSLLTELANGMNFPNAKYYDVYTYAENDKTFTRRILGDATGEMGAFARTSYKDKIREIGSWYGDDAWFVFNVYPWFQRGSSFELGTAAGMYSFVRDSGAKHYWTSFRIVLSI